MKLKDRYGENPFTKELIEQGTLRLVERKKKKRVEGRPGEAPYFLWEYYSVWEDRRPYDKDYQLGITAWLQLYEGKPNAQISYIVKAALADFINKDYVDLSYTNFTRICEERNIKVWVKQELYKQLKILVNANFIRPIAGYPGMYFINTNYFYNGALDRQLDLPVNDDVEVIGCDFTKEKDSSHFWLVDTSTLDGKPDEEDNTCESL